MSTFLEQNLAALRTAGYPVPDRPLPPPGWESANDTSAPSLRVPGASGGLVHLHSRRDALGEAERFIASVDASPTQTVASIAGVGLGFTVDVLERQSPDLPAVLTEVAFDRLVPFLSRRDWRARIETKRLGVFTADNASGSAGLRKLLEAREGELLPLVHPVFGREWPAEIAAAVAALGRAWHGARANRAARVAFEGLYAEHTLTNLARFARTVDIQSLEGICRGRAAMVVGAGPSLDARLPEIARVRDAVTLIAVDTALRPLLTAGIDPDLIVAVDPSDTNARHLLDLVHQTRAWFVGEPSLPPALFEAFDGRTIGFRVSRNEPWPWLLARGVELGTLNAWGSVLVTALDLACHMECDPVLMCGADLAYTAGRPYCRNTTFGRDAGLAGESEKRMAKRWMKSRAADLVSHSDLDGNPTRVPSYFPAIRDALLELAARRQPRRIVNATGAGILYGSPMEIGTIAGTLGEPLSVPKAAPRPWTRAPRMPRSCVSAGYEDEASWQALTQTLTGVWPHLQGRMLVEPLAALRALTISKDDSTGTNAVQGDASARWLRPLLEAPWTGPVLRFVQALDAAAPRWFERLEGPIAEAIREGEMDIATYMQFGLWVIRTSGDGVYAPPVAPFVRRLIDRLADAAMAASLPVRVETERAVLLTSFGRVDEAAATLEALSTQLYERPLVSEMMQALFAGARGRGLIAGLPRIPPEIAATARTWGEREWNAGRGSAMLWRYAIQCDACSGDIASARSHLREGLRRHPELSHVRAAMALEAWMSHESAFARELLDEKGQAPGALTAPAMFQLAVAEALVGQTDRAPRLFEQLNAIAPDFFGLSSPPNARWFFLARAAAALGDRALERRAHAAAHRFDVLAGHRGQVAPAVAPRDGIGAVLPRFELPQSPLLTTPVEPAPVGEAR